MRGYLASRGRQTRLNDQNRVGNAFILHFLEVVLDSIDTDLRYVGKLNDHRFRRIIVMSDHDDQLRPRWFILTRRIGMS